MIWKLKDMIKNGDITYKKGDKVVIFRRKSNGYPKHIKNDVEYIIIEIEGDSISIKENNPIFTKPSWNICPSIKIHKTFMIQKSFIRDLKINLILK